MTITIFDDTILPPSVIKADVRGSSVRQNERVVVQGGYQTVNVIWWNSLRKFEFGFVPMLPDEWAILEGLFEVTAGGAYGFLMQDPKDSKVALGQGELMAYNGVALGPSGVGYGEPSYQLMRVYSVIGSPRKTARRITRPRFATATRNGTPLTAGAGAGNISLNTQTGIVTFVADSSQAVSSIATGADTVVNFSGGAGIVADLDVGERVYLAGLAGSAAAALNGMSHEITAKGASSLTIDTVTTGLAATGGTAYKYPQADDVLEWSGNFYVPVHFDNDNLDWDMLRSGTFDDRLVGASGVVLMEVRE